MFKGIAGFQLFPTPQKRVKTLDVTSKSKHVSEQSGQNQPHFGQVNQTWDANKWMVPPHLRAKKVWWLYLLISKKIFKNEPTKLAGIHRNVAQHESWSEITKSPIPSAHPPALPPGICKRSHGVHPPRPWGSLTWLAAANFGASRCPAHSRRNPRPSVKIRQP